MAFIIAKNGNSMVLEAKLGIIGAGSKVTLGPESVQSGQLWVFLAEGSTTIPGVFFIIVSGTGYFLTVPDNVREGDYPTLEPQLPSLNPRQFWRMVPSDDGAYSTIQSYFDNGLVLDSSTVATKGDVTLQKSTKSDMCSCSDSQKWYLQHKA